MNFLNFLDLIEFPRIPCKVVRVLENGYYELVCSAGVLVNKYRDEDLMAFSGKLIEPTKLDKITLRQAAIMFNKGKKNAKIKTKRKETDWSEHIQITKSFR